MSIILYLLYIEIIRESTSESTLELLGKTCSMSLKKKPHSSIKGKILNPKIN